MIRRMALSTMPVIHGSNSSSQLGWRLPAPLISQWTTNTTATVHVPAKESASVTEGGKPLERVADLKVVRREPSAVVVEIGSGNYEFRSKW